jgi:hypothetical protein
MSPISAGAVADHVQSPARTLALGAHARVAQPDRRHEIAAGELDQHPGIDAVGLAGTRRKPFHLLRVGDLELPAGKLEPVVHEARTGTGGAWGERPSGGRRVPGRYGALLGE